MQIPRVWVIAKLLCEISILCIPLSASIMMPLAFAQIAQGQILPNQMAPGQTAPPFSQIINVVLGSSSPTNPKFYDPQSVSITAGTVVIWNNYDNSLHTVTFVTAGLYDSGIILPHHSVSNLFSNQGVFNYYCKIHPFMTGQLTVS